jgi:hypothetical protein
MSTEAPARVGGFTVLAAVTDTTQAKSLVVTTARHLILKNLGTNACFVNSGAATDTIDYPTTTTGQNGALIAPGEMCTYSKNNDSDPALCCICDTGLTTTLSIQSVDGI